MSNESFFDKVKDFVKGHPEQADQGLDKVGETLDERTGGQHTEHIAKGEEVVRERLGVPDDEATVPAPEPAPAPGDPTPTPGPTPEPPPVPSPDPVPTSPPETVPEAAPDTSEGQRP